MWEFEDRFEGPELDERRWLPYYLPQGQTYTYNGTTYAQDAQGAYWRQEANGYWSRMSAGR